MGSGLQQAHACPSKTARASQLVCPMLLHRTRSAALHQSKSSFPHIPHFLCPRHRPNTLNRRNDFGQLGDGQSGIMRVTSPVAVVTDVAFTVIDLGVYHSCALDTDGQAYCWGANGSGELGIGTRTNSATPAMIPGLFFSTISAGWDTRC